MGNERIKGMGNEKKKKSIDENAGKKQSCCAMMKMRFEKGRQRRKDRKNKSKVNEDEFVGLLEEETKMESDETTHDEKSDEDDSVLRRFDTGSKWKNVESAIGSIIDSSLVCTIGLDRG